MEAEKLAEFIGHTRADPVIAKQILQSQNWNVKDGLQIYSLLRGTSPCHHLSGATARTASHPSSFSSTINPSQKPPIAPKPHLDHRSITDKKFHQDSRMDGCQKLIPLIPSPRTRKVGIPGCSDDVVGHMVSESLRGPPPMRSCLSANNVIPNESEGHYCGRIGGLPPINNPNTQCISSTVTQNTLPAVALNHSFSRGLNRTSIGSAKNALLMEKVLGPVYNRDENRKLVAEDICWASRSITPTTCSSPITINSSSIISVNNNNNNSFNRYNNNNSLSLFTEDNVIRSHSIKVTELVPISPSPLCVSSGMIVHTTTTVSSSSSPLSSSTSSTSSSSSSSCNVPSIPESVNINDISLNSVCTCSHDVPSSKLYFSAHKDYIESPLKNSNSVSHNRTGGSLDESPLCLISNKSDTANLRLDNCLGISHENINRSLDHCGVRPIQNRKSPKIDTSKRPISKNEDVVDCAGRLPQMSRLVSTGNIVGASLSAPCSPAKPLLQKTDAVDLEDYDYYKKLSRGISKATDNVNLVSKARTEFAQGIWEAMDSNRSPFFVDTPLFTFTLPDLSIYCDEFRMFLERDLIEMSTLVSLESAGRLNWWAMVGASRRLWPLATTGDGNCLLHAASLGMWGFHDRLLTLRKALYEFLTQSQFSRPLWRRWRWQVTQLNRETGLVYSSEEWEAEWTNVLHLASSAPRAAKFVEDHPIGSTPNLSTANNRLSNGFLNGRQTDDSPGGHVYESLEEIHVLALAHVLRRPIVIVADVTLKDVSGEPLAPIPFGGVYLPLECPPSECQRSPLLLTYDAAHFSALVVMDPEVNDACHLPASIPVTDCSHELLPIQFVIDPGEEFRWGQDEYDLVVVHKLTITKHDKVGLLNEYLDIREVPISPGYLEAAASAMQVRDDEYFENGHIDVEKKSSESSFDSDEGPPYSDPGNGIFNSKMKASKQLQTVARQFGSIGKTMSKKIKKNLGTLSRFGRTGSMKKKEDYMKGCSLGKGNNRMIRVATHQNFILASAIHTEKRHAYQEEMIRNYLNTARVRFEKESEIKRKEEKEMQKLEREQLEHEVEIEGPVECINPGCTSYGTALTSYMCLICFQRQKEQENEYKRQANSNLNSPKLMHCKSDGAQYGAGKSRFYAEMDIDSAKTASNIPVTGALSTLKDGTIYLSNSTFYSDASNSFKNIPCSQTIVFKPVPNSTISDSSKQIVTIPHSGPEITEAKSAKSVTITSHINDAHNNITTVAVDDVKVNRDLPRLTSIKATDGSNTCSGGPSQPCLGNNCPFFGSTSTKGYCSKCHQLRSINLPSDMVLLPVSYVHI